MENLPNKLLLIQIFINYIESLQSDYKSMSKNFGGVNKKLFWQTIYLLHRRKAYRTTYQAVVVNLVIFMCGIRKEDK